MSDLFFLIILGISYIPLHTLNKCLELRRFYYLISLILINIYDFTLFPSTVNILYDGYTIEKIPVVIWENTIDFSLIEHSYNLMVCLIRCHDYFHPGCIEIANHHKFHLHPHLFPYFHIFDVPFAWLFAPILFPILIEHCLFGPFKLCFPTIKYHKTVFLL